MNRGEIREAILYFFDVIEGQHAPEERECKLPLALDQLAFAYHFAAVEFDDADYPDAPRKEYNDLREIVGPRFPDCGYYNVALDVSIKIAEDSVGVGDAIDDICDIAIDLDEVLWLWTNTSIDNALWQFRDSFEYHWGEHLRDLQLYLHKKKQEQ